MVIRAILVKMEIKDIKVIQVISELMENKYVKYLLLYPDQATALREMLALKDQLEYRDLLDQRYLTC